MKTLIYTSYDTANQTWNVFNMNNECIHYGDIDSLECWLDEHSGSYEESENSTFN